MSFIESLMRKQFVGSFNVMCIRNKIIIWEENFSNLCVDQGLNDMLDVYFSDATQSTDWYVGLKGSSQTPASNWTASGIGTQFTEFTNYDESTREAWVEAGVSSKQITNSASPAEFTISASGTVYGAFIINNNTKGGTTGKLFCISDFAVSRPVVDNDVLRITYTLNIADA